MKKLLLLAIFFGSVSTLLAQNVGINATGAAPNGSAMLDVSSTNSGMLIPRMTQAQRNAIGAPATSLLIYQTNANPGFYYWDGAQWVRLFNGDAWQLTGNAGTNPTNNFLGTTDAQQLRFRTNNVERMRIFADGRVVVNNAGAFPGTSFNSFAAGTGNAIGAEASGSGDAIFGQNTGTGDGLVGIATGAGFGIVGLNTSTGGALISTSNATGTGRAGEFQSLNTASTTQALISFQNSTSTNINAASVWGQSESTRSGVFLANFQSNNTIALTGQYLGGGFNDAIGVYGLSQPAAGWGYGVLGQGNFYALFGIGDFGVTGGKFFEIDHPLDPENKKLRHANIESNEILNHYRGNVVLDATGNATVTLPEYFNAININFSYQLTPIGSPAPSLYISEEIENNQFKISGGSPGQKISWVVQAERNDKYIQTNPGKRNMEIEKKDHEKGKYLDPESWGLPENKSIFFEYKHKNAEKTNSPQNSLKKSGTK